MMPFTDQDKNRICDSDISDRKKKKILQIFE